MKIGVNYPAGPHSLPPARFGRLAEELGFESMWAGEHPVVPVEIRGDYPQLVDGDVPEAYAHVADPLICLAHAAAATERLRLGTGVCLVTERNPLVVFGIRRGEIAAGTAVRQTAPMAGMAFGAVDDFGVKAVRYDGNRIGLG